MKFCPIVKYFRQSRFKILSTAKRPSNNGKVLNFLPKCKISPNLVTLRKLNVLMWLWHATQPMLI